MVERASDILSRLTGDDDALQQEIAFEKLCADVAMQIHEARTSAGLTQSEVARRVGTTQSAIARIEDADYAGHTLRTLNRIAWVLGLNVLVRLESPESISTWIPPVNLVNNTWACYENYFLSKSGHKHGQEEGWTYNLKETGIKEGIEAGTIYGGAAALIRA